MEVIMKRLLNGQQVGEEKMIWTPGVNLNSNDAELGQRYGIPKKQFYQDLTQ